MKNIYCLLLTLLVLAACSADSPPIVGCEAVDDIIPVCGMQAPEDIAALEDGRHLLLSNYAGMKEGKGTISLFDTRSANITPLLPSPASMMKTADPAWGQPQCSPPALDQFRPHGTHLHRLADQRWRYLVVNHGGRESIEMFELTGTGSASALAWRGCILAAADTVINDVVGLSDGDVIFSRMFHYGNLREYLQSFLAIDTGDLWRWNKETGLRILPGTAAAQPNGLEISADERFVFANMYFEKQVWKIDPSSGETLAVADVANADNSAWGTDGRLWLATHTATVSEMVACLANQAMPCGAAFEIVALDPVTMQFEVVYSHRGPPMGAATVAVPQDGRVYIGSFVGDRMISVPNFIPQQ